MTNDFVNKRREDPACKMLRSGFGVQPKSTQHTEPAVSFGSGGRDAFNKVRSVAPGCAGPSKVAAGSGPVLVTRVVLSSMRSVGWPGRCSYLPSVCSAYSRSSRATSAPSLHGEACDPLWAAPVMGVCVKQAQAWPHAHHTMLNEHHPSPPLARCTCRLSTPRPWLPAIARAPSTSFT